MKAELRSHGVVETWIVQVEVDPPLITTTGYRRKQAVQIDRALVVFKKIDNAERHATEMTLFGNNVLREGGKGAAVRLSAGPWYGHVDLYRAILPVAEGALP